MLLELSIQNIALIDRLRVQFRPGLNVLTGETGAGKSIVVDSMNLSLGGRADRELIRSGAQKATVEAVFDISEDGSAAAALDVLGLTAEDGYLAISRELTAGGRNLCRVAGSVQPLAQLRAVASALTELHGQHEHQALLSPARHAQLMDAYGDAAHQALLSAVQGAHARYESARRRQAALLRERGERERTLDMLTVQLDELRALKLKPGEDEALERQFAIMGSAEKITTSLDTACHLVYQGSDRAPSAQEALGRAVSAMESIASFDPRFEDACRRLADLYAQAQDLGYELQSMREDTDFDPAQLDKVGERLDALDRAKRRYGPTLSEVIAFRDRAEAELSALKKGDETLLDARAETARLRAELDAACAALTASRQALGARLSADMARHLAELNMASTRFEPQITALGAPGPAGADAVEFMISLNPGEPLKPLSATASGGELSRIMLALKVIMADRDQVGSMIFDEVDTGVSGRTAQVVGEKLAAIGARCQVIAVSHLPQIAALADAHFVVEKAVTEGRTTSAVRLLDDEGRVAELARMVGGAGDPESGLRHARNMLTAARALKDGWAR